jgi:putative ABC transport system permease protein
LLLAGIVRQLGMNIEVRATLIPLQDQITGSSRASLLLLLAAAAAVLLIGCVNIANLLLAQAVTRRSEMAIRSAVGAHPARLTRQVLVESLLLSTLGGLCGLAVAYSAMRLILTNVPIDLPRMDEVHLNGWMLLFTMGVSTATGLLFASLPAWYVTRIDPLATTRSSTRSATSGSRISRLRSLLVGVETALSVACLIAGGLLLHSFINLLSVDTGFAARQLVTVDLNLPSARYSDVATKNSLLNALLQRTGALPGVSASAISNRLPLSGEIDNNLVLAEGVDVPFEERPIAAVRNVSPGYLTTIGIPLRKGRLFDDTDRNRRVALVSALAAERIWPGQDVIGKRFRRGDMSAPLNEIVGVVGDVRAVSLNKNPFLTIYVPYWEGFGNDLSLVVKTAGDPGVVSSEIRGLIRESDPEIPVSAFQTMQGIVMSSVAPRRFQTVLVLLFAGAAALLAGLGIYGIVSYSTSQRTNEIGIRMALGAQRPTIAHLVFGQALFPVGMGLIGGVLLSFGLRRVLSSLLFGVSPADPATILGVICFLGIVAAAAVYFPLRRAVRISPIIALRYE